MLQTALEQLPASTQPVSVSDFKDILISLCDYLHLDMVIIFTTVNNSVQSHTLSLRWKIYTHNSLVDTCKDEQPELQASQAKLGDLEDRTRCNNIKFCGEPESISAPKLKSFLHQLHTLVPAAHDFELILDPTHSIPKPAYLPDTVQKHVLARIHYYHVKEKAMKAARKIYAFPVNFQELLCMLTCPKLHTF